MESPKLLDEYDIIFAGGGVSGGIAAGRLAAADPSLRILMLEMGPHTLNDLSCIQPGLYLRHLAPDSKKVRHIVAAPSEHLNGRQLITQCGHCVGGASSVNFAMYTRAAASDYDDWAYQHDNPGWSFADLLPLMKKAETYQNAANRATHGYEGPLKVSYGSGVTDISKDFIATLASYDKNLTVTDDANRMVDDCNRIEVWPKWIDQDTGRRSDVAHHYIYNNVKKSKSFHVVAGCTVRKVIIEDEKATGVEYVYNENALGTVTHTVRAKKLVVLSAGAYGSPALLERSGIGASDVLERNGIAQIVDLPGVGENFNDHWLIFVPFRAKEGYDTIDAFVRGDPKEVEKCTAQWENGGKGPMAGNGFDGGVKFRPSPQDLAAIGSEFAPTWEKFFAPYPDKPICWFGVRTEYGGMGPLPPPNEKYFTIGGVITYPMSTGHVHITSANDVTAPLMFDSGMFSRKEDLAVMRYMYKRSREIARRMAAYNGERVADHPKFPLESAAEVLAVAEEGQEPRPVPMNAPDIVYSADDDGAIDDMLKAHCGAAWHSLGTCAMKPQEKGGVVDPCLSVYGVSNLKVADMSIAPANVACNTYSTAIAIGEKAALIIAEELGICGV